MGQEIEATFVEYGFDLVYRKLNSLVTSNNIPLCLYLVKVVVNVLTKVGPGGLATPVAIVFVLRASIKLVFAAINVTGDISNKNKTMIVLLRLRC